MRTDVRTKKCVARSQVLTTRTGRPVERVVHLAQVLADPPQLLRLLVEVDHDALADRPRVFDRAQDPVRRVHRLPLRGLGRGEQAVPRHLRVPVLRVRHERLPRLLGLGPLHLGLALGDHLVVLAQLRHVGVFLGLVLQLAHLHAKGFADLGHPPQALLARPHALEPGLGRVAGAAAGEEPAGAGLLVDGLALLVRGLDGLAELLVLKE